MEDTAKTKERGFVDTIRQNYGNDVAKQIGDKEYDVYSHEMQKANWEILNKQKEQEIMEVLRRNDEIIQKRIDTYNKKQQQLEERQRERETLMQQQSQTWHWEIGSSG